MVRPDLMVDLRCWRRRASSGSGAEPPEEDEEKERDEEPRPEALREIAEERGEALRSEIFREAEKRPEEDLVFFFMPTP